MKPPPSRLISHTCTAAVLCLITVLADYHLRFDLSDAKRIIPIEWLLATYGFTFAILSIAKGGMRASHRIVLVICLFIFACCLFVGVFMPRLIRN